MIRRIAQTYAAIAREASRGPQNADRAAFDRLYNIAYLFRKDGSIDKQYKLQYAQSGILTPSDFAFARDAVAAECSPNVETVIIHDLDLETLRRHRLDGSTLNWADRRLDIYELRER